MSRNEDPWPILLIFGVLFFWLMPVVAWVDYRTMKRLYGKRYSFWHGYRRTP